jgi:ribosome-associated translation inhibitor RaiA
LLEIIFQPHKSSFEVHAMITNCAANEGFEISPRFRRTVEDRIARLERDAEFDEAQVSVLEDVDHIRRQMRLVAVQRAEALRMRIFLDRARTRLPRPLIAL